MMNSQREKFCTGQYPRFDSPRFKYCGSCIIDALFVVILSNLD